MGRDTFRHSLHMPLETRVECEIGRDTVLAACSCAIDAWAEFIFSFSSSVGHMSEDRLLDVVDFRGAHSAVLRCPSQRASSATLEWSAGRGKDACVLHSGDVMSAEGGSHANSSASRYGDAQLGSRYPCSCQVSMSVSPCFLVVVSSCPQEGPIGVTSWCKCVCLRLSCASL